MRWGRLASSPRRRRRASSYSAWLPSNQRVLPSPSKTRTCVEMRSRKNRSWLIDHGAAGEVDQGLLEHAHRVHVQVVGRLVQQDQVAAAAEQLGQVDAVPLAAGQLARPCFCCCVPRKLNRATYARRSHRRPAQLDHVLAVGDLLEDRAVAIERVAVLVDVGRAPRSAPTRIVPGVGLLLADDHAEQRGLAGAVGPDDADDPAGRQRRTAGRRSAGGPP